MHVRPTLVWVSLSLALCANGAAYIFDLYDQLAWIDKALHTFTAFAVTLAVVRWLERAGALHALRTHPALQLVVVAALGLALGVFWEFGEWGFDQLSQENSIKGMTDTVLDLFMDLAGAVAAALSCRRRGR